MRTFVLLAVALTIVSLTGCGSMRKPGFPKQSYDEKKQIKDLERVFEASGMLTNYYEMAKTAPENALKMERNRIINGRLTLINLNYNRFVGEFCFSKQGLDTATEMTELGVNLATTAVGGAGTKTVLAAISAGVTGSKVVIDKNFFYEKTVPVLVTAMNAQRKKVLASILRGMNQSAENYPLAQALSDLDEYYFAGTFLGALQTMQVDAGSKEAEANQKLNDIRETGFQDDDAGRLLQSFWMPGLPSDLTPNGERQKALEDWLEANQMGDVPLQTLITGDLFSKAREKAVKDLKIQKP